MPLDKLFVFDIETVPDTDAAQKLLNTTSSSIQTLREQLIDYHVEVSGGNPFPKHVFHSVVSVSMLVADIEKYQDKEYYNLIGLSTLSLLNNTEEQITEKFFTYISKHLPKIISYNGRAFDLPVMKYRAMKYNISLEELYKSGDKWSNYHQKYALNWHCDLLDALSDFGLSTKAKMKEICSILGLPGKIDMDGSKVTNKFDEGKFKEIDDYCELDVLNTYLIYLNYALLIGSITKEHFIKMNHELKKYLKSHQEKKDNFKLFLEEWGKTDTRHLF